MRLRRAIGQEQLELFRARPGAFAPRDTQDLMAYSFFSLAKSHRTAPRRADLALASPLAKLRQLFAPNSAS